MTDEKNKTLLIMAAGMGSRFGGLKQIEPVGPNGEFLIDYSIYDAIKAGYNKVIFIIKEENFEVFKDTIGKRIEDKIRVEYAFQRLTDVPDGFVVPKERIKPWGTAHAILAAKDLINEPFTIINADDFYGSDAYVVSSNFLSNCSNEYAVTGYMIKNVLSKNGAVKRGVCLSSNNYLTKLLESSVKMENGNICANPLDNSDSFIMDENDVVSMNMLSFEPSIFNYIEDYFRNFLTEKVNDLSCECLIPDVINYLVLNNIVNVKVLSTSSVWYGVTYKEDKDEVVENIQKLITDGKYPYNLWN